LFPYRPFGDGNKVIIGRLKEKFLYKNKDTLTFNDLKYNNSTKCYNLTQLEPAQLINWTDKFMPKGLVESNLYFALFYSFQDVTNKYYLISIFTIADDWTRLHLLSIDKKYNLIEQFEIGESEMYLIDQNEEKMKCLYVTSYALKINKNKYKIVQKETTINFFAMEKKDTLMVDLKIYELEITQDGHFIKNKIHVP
jgi:hypothetical protein